MLPACFSVRLQQEAAVGEQTLRLGPSRWQCISTWMVSRARSTSPYYNEAAGRADRWPRLGFLRCDLPPAIEPARRGAARSAAGVLGPCARYPPSSGTTLRHMTPREGTEQMRYIFRWVIPLIFLPVAPGFSQGTPPPPDVRGDAGDWWWVVLMVLLIGTAVWFFMRRRGAP